jgi:hypothetical protein
MNKFKYIVFIILTIFFIPKWTILCEYNVKGLDDEIYYTLSGSWDEYYEYKDIELDPYKFSWGRGEWAFNHSIIIDFGTKPAKFYIGGDQIYELLSVEKISLEKYKLNLKGPWVVKELGKRRNVEGELCIFIHTVNKNEIWFESCPDQSILQGGKNRIYYRISSPN